MHERIDNVELGIYSSHSLISPHCTEGHNRPKWDKNHTAFPMDDFDDVGD